MQRTVLTIQKGEQFHPFAPETSLPVSARLFAGKQILLDFHRHRVSRFRWNVTGTHFRLPGDPVSLEILPETGNSLPCLPNFTRSQREGRGKPRRAGNWVCNYGASHHGRVPTRPLSLAFGSWGKCERVVSLTFLFKKTGFFIRQQATAGQERVLSLGFSFHVCDLYLPKQLGVQMKRKYFSVTCFLRLFVPPASEASSERKRLCPRFLNVGGCSFRASVVFAKRATDSVYVSAWCTRGDDNRVDIVICARDFSTAADVRSARSWFSLETHTDTHTY